MGARPWERKIIHYQGTLAGDFGGRPYLVVMAGDPARRPIR